MFQAGYGHTHYPVPGIFKVSKGAGENVGSRHHLFIGQRTQAWLEVTDATRDQLMSDLLEQCQNLESVYPYIINLHLGVTSYNLSLI